MQKYMVKKPSNDVVQESPAIQDAILTLSDPKSEKVITTEAATSVKDLVNLWSKFISLTEASKTVNSLLLTSRKNIDENKDENKTNIKKKTRIVSDKYNLSTTYGSEMKESSDTNIGKNIRDDYLPEPPILDEFYQDINDVFDQDANKILSENSQENSSNKKVNLDDLHSAELLTKINKLVEELEKINTFFRLPENYMKMNGNELIESIKDSIEEKNIEDSVETENVQSILCGELLDNMVMFQKEQKTAIDDFDKFVFKKINFKLPSLFDMKAKLFFEYINKMKKEFEKLIIEKEVESLLKLFNQSKNPLFELEKRFESIYVTELLYIFKLLCHNPIIARYQFMSVYEAISRRFLEGKMKNLSDEEYDKITEKMKKIHLIVSYNSLRGSLSFFLKKSFYNFEVSLTKSAEYLMIKLNETNTSDNLNNLRTELKILEDKLSEYEKYKEYFIEKKTTTAKKDVLIDLKNLKKYNVVKGNSKDKSSFEIQYELYKKSFSKDRECSLNSKNAQNNQQIYEDAKKLRQEYGLLDTSPTAPNKTKEPKQGKSNTSMDNSTNQTNLKLAQKNSLPMIPSYGNRCIEDGCKGRQPNQVPLPASNVQSKNFGFSQTNRIQNSTPAYISPNVRKNANPEFLKANNRLRNTPRKSKSLFKKIANGFDNLIEKIENKPEINTSISKKQPIYSSDPKFYEEENEIQNENNGNTMVMNHETVTKLVLRPGELMVQYFKNQGFYLPHSFAREYDKKLEGQNIGNFYIYYHSSDPDYNLSYLMRNGKVNKLNIVKADSGNFKLENENEEFESAFELVQSLLVNGIKEKPLFY